MDKEWGERQRQEYRQKSKEEDKYIIKLALWMFAIIFILGALAGGGEVFMKMMLFLLGMILVSIPLMSVKYL